MVDGPYPSHPERAGTGPEAARERTAGDRARDRLSDDPPAVADTRALDPRDRELAQRAMSAEDPRAGSDVAHRITDPALKAETLSALAINADDPSVGSDIAHHIDPFTTDADGDSIHDATLNTIATKPTDPRRGADIAEGIQTPRIKADSLSAIAINADDPHIGSDIAHHIDPTITNADGDSIKDITLARIARAAPDPQIGRSIADGIGNARLKAATIDEIAVAGA